MLPVGEWTPRERVHLMMLAKRSAGGLRDSEALLASLRQSLTSLECQPQALTPDWDWAPRRFSSS
jgi:hypothetical protein